MRSVLATLGLLAGPRLTRRLRGPLLLALLLTPVLLATDPDAPVARLLDVALACAALAWLLRAHREGGLVQALLPPVAATTLLLALLPGAGPLHALAFMALACVTWLGLREGVRQLGLDTGALTRTWLRGARLAGDAPWRLRLGRHEACAHIGSVPVPARLEPLHFLVTGSTGSGKSLCFQQLLEAARARGQRAVVADAGAEFLQRFGRAQDVILNPFDARSRAWSPFAEIDGPWDCERLARALVPDAGGDAQWQGYAQALTAAVLLRLWQRGEATNGRLLHQLTVAGRDELAQLLAGLPAHSLLEPGAERMLGVVRGILGRHLGVLAALDPGAGVGAFSIRHFIARDSDRWLFLTVRDDQAAALRPLLACWLDLAISGLLALPADPVRRIWFALDELASLGPVQGLPDLLTRARKQGGCAIVGLQSIAQLDALYGCDQAQTLLACLSTVVALRAPDARTADYLSRHLGSAEWREESTGATPRQVLSAAVLPSQLQALPDREGFLRLAGDEPVRPVRIALPAGEPTGLGAFEDIAPR